MALILLEQIEKANDIKKIDKEKLPELASEIRAFLIEKISRNGGHLASNLGVVELTIALHRVLNFPEDKLIWDVGHQSYTHKILTGRRDGFDKMRKYGGMMVSRSARRATATPLIPATVRPLFPQGLAMWRRGICRSRTTQSYR